MQCVRSVRLGAAKDAEPIHSARRVCVCVCRARRHGCHVCVCVLLCCHAQVLTHAKNRSLREELYKANITRASSGDLDNEPIINQVSH